MPAAVEDLSLESDGGDVDGDEVEGEELAAALPRRYKEAASVSLGLERCYVLGLAAAGEKVAVLTDSGALTVHRRDTLVRSSELKGHTGTVTGLVAREDTLYSSSHDQTVCVWDLRDGKCASTLRDTSDTSKQYGPGAGTKLLSCVSVSSNGTTVVAGTDQVGCDSYLMFWDTRKPSKLLGGYWESHSDDITSVLFHPSSPATLASGSTDGQVNIFDTSQSDEDSALTTSLHTEDSVSKLAWYSRSGDADQLAVSTHTEGLQLWATADVGAHTVLSRSDLCHGVRRTASEHAYIAGLHAVQNGDGLEVLVGSSYTASPCLRLAFVKNKKAKPCGELREAKGEVRCSLSLAEGLLTGGEDGVVRLWKEGEVEDGGKDDSSKMVNKNKVRNKPY